MTMANSVTKVKNKKIEHRGYSVKLPVCVLTIKYFVSTGLYDYYIHIMT